MSKVVVIEEEKEEILYLRGFLEAFKGMVERIIDRRTLSAFQEKGVLSVSEFTIADGNHVFKCPTWLRIRWLEDLHIQKKN
ncbi:putative thiamine pyrophosphokinase 1 isoform X2 [Iris pallida]|uniref:Thiamine pyrophosphokinase 1 isoform X2 n=1 Tax=Iris pallida TaxID=29817 RepID=A0AAX6HZ61_IRIPA|nr:putative thiamine pyrophosphokinase 1 isoform X2 [Iris pallida]